ncbi:phytanoyl-CoA dioxygenase family protein [Ferrimonas marina]|uniref:Phytanoyl-CoA dioxygenase (PhyH) n=1 Tax=Ferrimonas marina TaxID=299255 RepID=A0A1M5ND27_9GAMM|nr:phytanoyl-CoA dioxygenase family protein [Ferrimonas marina]SHG87410.1 Phytanoyl-CoA dioxygenase (PhyH) [Ferrimonas marina]
MDYHALAKRFWQQGYLVIENFFDPQLMARYDSAIQTHFNAGPEVLFNQEFLDKSDVEVVPWFPLREGQELFDEVGQDPRLSQLTEAILGSGWGPQYCMVMWSPPGSKGQAWHQDCPPEDQAHFNLNRLVYTADITDAIGGYTQVVPGSHRRGELPAGPTDQDFADQVTLRPKRGTLVLLHGHTWHRVQPVQQHRSSTNYRAAPAGTPEDITDVCVYCNMRYRFSTEEVVEQRGLA